MFNVIKIGSHHGKAGFAKQNVFLVRPHIQIPDTKVQKWGREYILFYLTPPEAIFQMCSNHDEDQFFPLSGEICVDKFGIKYINTTFQDTNDLYWITTITGDGYNINNSNLIKKDKQSQSEIFSMAFNLNEPKMFEATLILQPGDKLKVGRWVSVFCPEKNPFLKNWQPEV